MGGGTGLGMIKQRSFRIYMRPVIATILPMILSGCVGLGAWTLGTRTAEGDHQAIQPTRGTIAPHKPERGALIETAADLQTQWGKPDRIKAVESGGEEWIYKTDGLRWSGMLLYVMIVPLPAMVPVGSQYLSVLVQDGRIERVTKVDWAFKGGAYCGYFGMMYGRLGCGTGTFEETQPSGQGPSPQQ